MLRGLGFSQQEISDSIDMSRQSVAYQLKKLKKEAVLYGATNIFSKKTGMIKPDSRDLEDALLTVEILLDEDRGSRQLCLRFTSTSLGPSWGLMDPPPNGRRVGRRRSALDWAGQNRLVMK